MWDQDDYLARWLHGLCAIPVLIFILVDVYLLVTGSWFSLWALTRNGLGVGAVFLEYRLVKYAITGRDCINRDQY